MEEASDLYRQGDYAGALQRLSMAPGLLAAVPILDRPGGQARARLFFDLGRCHLASGDSALARVALEYAFDLHPGIREGMLPLPHDRALEETRAYLHRLALYRRRETVQATSRWKAAGRSLILPGWGQAYRGHRTRGRVVMGAAGALTVAWFVADRTYRSAYDAYRSTTVDDLRLDERKGDASDPRPFEVRFSRVRSRARTANAVLCALGAVWALGVLDNLYIGPGGLAMRVAFR